MNKYQESQARIAEAESHLAAGDVSAARQQYRLAADVQRSFVSCIIGRRSLSPDQARTISIYGLSAATLYYRAGELDTAERLVHQLLMRKDLERRARTQLKELLVCVWDEQSRALADQRAGMEMEE